MKTKNGCKISGLRPYDWGVWGGDFQFGYIDHPTFGSVIWDLEGRAQYVKNCNSDDLSGFDIAREK